MFSDLTSRTLPLNLQYFPKTPDSSPRVAEENIPSNHPVNGLLLVKIEVRGGRGYSNEGSEAFESASGSMREISRSAKMREGVCNIPMGGNSAVGIKIPLDLIIDR